MYNGDEQLTELNCGCIIFEDEAGSHHHQFCLPHQREIDRAMKIDAKLEGK